LLCVCSCLPLTAPGQTNFLPGYYVRHRSDTVRGLVEYRPGDKMSEVIRFKTAKDSRSVELLPDDVMLVVVQDKNFFEPFSYTPFNEEPFSGFFKKIITGRLFLYRYKDRLFVKKGNDDLREVTKRRKQVDVSLIANDYSGFGTLRTLIGDCQSMEEQFLLDNYGTLIGTKNIVNKYNSCFPEGTNEIIDIEVASHLDIGVQATLNESQLVFSRTSLSNANFDWSPSIGGGVYFSLFTSAMGDNLRFVVEPSFARYSSYSYFQSNQGANDLFIKYSYVRMPILLRYFYKSVFLDLGETNMIVISNHTTWRQESASTGGDNVITTANGPPYKITTGVLGIMGGVGVRAKIAGMPLLTSVRASEILRSASDAVHNRPGVKWLDLNVALQLTHY
jgi:hypothetical protein